MDNRLLSVRGRIFDIQRFSIHDGPGIRTIVFLKGCLLRCRWCCNPESQNYEIQEMKKDDGRITTVGEDITVGEVMDIVQKDYNYYYRSGGGLTLSGGEFLLQPDFSEALLRVSKDEGINTAVETTSAVDFSTIERVLPYIDHYLCDIKHIDPEKHKAFCGKSNEIILENAKKIAERANRIVVRVPVIPGFNDTPEEIRKIAEFTVSLKTVKEIHLLPYHRLGQDKYRWLGREYTLDGIKPPEKGKMYELREVAASVGLKAQIGG